MPTQDETRREIEALRRRADQLEAEAAKRTALRDRLAALAVAAESVPWEQFADQLDSILEEVRSLSSGLPFDSDSTNVESMSSTAISSGSLERAKSRSVAYKNGHPFVVALYDQAATGKKRRQTVTDWAKAHGVKPGTAASWVAEDGKRIPMRYAKMIEKELGVPATLATWKNGIVTDEK